MDNHLPDQLFAFAVLACANLNWIGAENLSGSNCPSSFNTAHRATSIQFGSLTFDLPSPTVVRQSQNQNATASSANLYQPDVMMPQIGHSLSSPASFALPSSDGAMDTLLVATPRPSTTGLTIFSSDGSASPWEYVVSPTMPYEWMDPDYSF